MIVTLSGEPMPTELIGRPGQVWAAATAGGARCWLFALTEDAARVAHESLRDRHDPVLTTGQAARLLRRSQQSVIRAFDGGHLKGWRIPGSRFRRLPLSAVIAAAAEWGIELPPAEVAELQGGTDARRQKT